MLPLISLTDLLPPLNACCDGCKVHLRGHRDAHPMISNYALLAKLLLHLESRQQSANQQQPAKRSWLQHGQSTQHHWDSESFAIPPIKTNPTAFRLAAGFPRHSPCVGAA